MSKIHNKNTQIELMVRKFLFANGYRFRVNDKRYPGKPDIVLPKYKTVIFIHGCFWHQHQGCKKSHIPKSNIDYWLPKLTSNLKRDKVKIEQLKDMGWNVLVIWECQLKTSPNKVLDDLLVELKAANK